MEHLVSKQEAVERQVVGQEAGLAGGIPNIHLPAEFWQVLSEKGR